MNDVAGGSVVWKLDGDVSGLNTAVSEAKAEVSSFSTLTQAAEDNVRSSFSTMVASAQISFASLRGAVDDGNGVIATVQSAAEGAVGEITLLGDAASGAGDAFITAGGEMEVAAAEAEESAGIFEGLGDSLKETFLPLAALFVGYKAIEEVFTDVNDDTNEYNTAQAQLINTLSSGTSVIGLTISQLDDLAESNSKNNDITSAANLSAENILATYGGLGKQVFTSAAGQVDNLATSMANIRGEAVPSLQETNQAATLLGRALEDPADATNTLRSAGVKLSTSQIDVIKQIQSTNGVAAAQQQLMSDLADTVGGKASASVDTYQGKLVNIQKTIYEFAGNAISAMQKALTDVGHVFDDVGSAIIRNKPLLEAIEGVFVALAIFLAGALLAAIAGAIVGFIGISAAALPWIAAAALIGAAAALIVTHFDDIKSRLDVLKPYWDDLVSIWNKYIYPAFKTVGDYVGKQLVGAFGSIKSSLDKLWLTLKPYEPQLRILAIVFGVALLAPLVLVATAFGVLLIVGALVIGWIADLIGWIVKVSVDIADFEIKFVAAVANIYEGIISKGADIVEWFLDLPGNIINALAKAADWLVKTGSDIIGGLVNGISSVADDVTGAIKTASDKIGAFFTGAVSWLYDTGRAVVQGLINGMESMLKDVTNAAGDIGSAVENKVKSLLGIHSPSTVFHDIGVNIGQGLVNGIGTMQSAAASAMGDLTTGAGSLNLNANLNTSAGASIASGLDNRPASIPQSASTNVTVHLNQSGIVATSRSAFRNIMKDGISAVNEELRARRLPLIADGKLSGSSTA